MVNSISFLEGFQPRRSGGINHMDHMRVLLEMFLSYGSKDDL